MNASATPPGAIGGKYHFLLRRLHSLSGIVPVGVFVIFHLFTNAQIIRGGSHFQHEVSFIHSLPALLFVEIALWSAIGFHAAMGLAYTFIGAKPNAASYPHWSNWRYTLQRVTGIIAIGFIFVHIATLRWRWNLMGVYTPFFLKGITPGGEVVALSTVSTAKALQAAWWIAALYFIGVFSVVFHWANGLWTAAITWGMTITVKAQKRWGVVCTLLFLALFTFSVAAFYGALTLKETDRPTEYNAWDFMAEQYKTGNPIDVHDANVGDRLNLSELLKMNLPSPPIDTPRDVMGNSSPGF